MKFYGYFDEQTGSLKRIFSTDANDLRLVELNRQEGEVAVELPDPTVLNSPETLSLECVNREYATSENAHG